MRVEKGMVNVIQFGGKLFAENVIFMPSFERW